MSIKDDNSFDGENTSKISSLTTIDCVQENKENVTLIWFNPTKNTTVNTDKIKEDLRAVNNVVIFHTDTDLFIEDIESRKKEKILVIISAKNAFELLPRITTLSQLDLIFIFPENREEYKHLYDDHCKVANIFDNSDDLIKAIKGSIKCINRQSALVSSYDHHQQGTRDISKQSAEFLWFQLFNDVIQHLPHDNKAKEEMLTACRQYYRGNQRILKDIDEFNEDYHIDACIRWYTKNTFVYQMINKALRTEDIEQLYVFRYYIADLSKQLAQECEKMKNSDEKKIVLYRGTSFNQEEVEILKLMEGKLIATNGYWSTSRKRSYALTFAGSDPNTVPVLLEIECDLHDCNDSIIFAKIARLSVFPEEEEYLFDAGSIFQIEKIREETDGNTNIYVVQIKASGKGRELAKQYIEEYREEMKYESPRIMLGILLKRLGKFEKSLNYFEQLLKNPGDEKISHIHNRIGIALKHQSKYDLALEHFNKARDLTSKSDPSERVHLALILHGIGLVFDRQEKSFKALEYYYKAIKILKQAIGNKNRSSADIYNCIGRYYSRRRNYEAADHYQQKVLQIRRSCLPPDHVHHAFSYISIAKTCSRKKNYEEALEYNLKALELRQKCLLPDHLNIASSLHDIGKMYSKKKDSEKALDYYWKSLEMTRKCLPPSQHCTVPAILEDIASIYKNDPKEALQYRLEALNVQKNLKPINYTYMVLTVDRIADTYKSMDENQESLKYYEEALNIRKKELSNDKLNLALNLDRLAFVYEKMGKLTQTLECYFKILDMCTYDYHSHHYLCKKTRQNIKRVKRKHK